MKDPIWDIDEQSLSDTAPLEAKIKFWLRYAILAPSAHNTQPWKWSISHSVLKVFRNEEYTLQDSDPTLRETFISLGAFIENFAVAAAHWGYDAEVCDLVNVTTRLHVADIKITKAKGYNLESSIFAGISKRCTNRGEYKVKELPTGLIKRLHVSLEDGIRVFVISDTNRKKKIGALVGSGTRIALSMRTMRHELTNLIFREQDGVDTGMTLETLTEKAPHKVSGSEWVIKHLDPIEEGKKWEKSFAESPLLVVIGSECDGSEDWVNAGRVMQRVLLSAAAQDITHCISAAPIEIPTLVPLLRRNISSNYRPQVLFRLGIPTNPSLTRHSPRRPVT